MLGIDWDTVYTHIVCPVCSMYRAFLLRGGFIIIDSDYMKIAIELAKKGIGKVNPNPLVGAVIVKNGKIIGKGFHEKYGQAHAERNALADCKESAVGSVLYVTLEPCCHYGKTPPCTDAIIESGISRVVIGSGDPNPLVKEKSIAILREHGVEVTEAVLKEECDQLNQIYFHFINTHQPYVILKYAMTLDGKIATASGESKWITSEMARSQVHKERLRCAAIMVGVGTVLKDDPMLTCRLPGARNPLRVICDTNLRIPLDCKIVRTSKTIPTILATSCDEQARQERYKEFGCEVLVLSKKEKINLPLLMQILGKRGIDSVFIEGGQELSWSAFKSNIVNKVQVYISPKILGGIDGKTPVGGSGVEYLKNAIRLSKPQISTYGEDIMLESEVLSCSQEL